jgi:hypothetical protein
VPYWCVGGGLGFGGGLAQGEGAIEHWTLGWDIPHQGGRHGELSVWTQNGGGALCFMVIVKYVLYLIVLAKKIK